MNDERVHTGAAALGRWLLIAALILIGIALYFRYAPSNLPVAPPTIQEGS